MNDPLRPRRTLRYLQTLHARNRFRVGVQNHIGYRADLPAPPPAQACRNVACAKNNATRCRRLATDTCLRRTGRWNRRTAWRVQPAASCTPGLTACLLLDGKDHHTCTEPEPRTSAVYCRLTPGTLLKHKERAEQRRILRQVLRAPEPPSYADEQTFLTAYTPQLPSGSLLHTALP